MDFKTFVYHAKFSYIKIKGFKTEESCFEGQKLKQAWINFHLCQKI